MKRHKKTLLWSIIVLVSVAAFLVALDLLAPKIINLDSTKELIQKLASEKMGGTVNYDRIEPSLFPRPGIIIEHASINIPETAEGTVSSIRLYPKVLPLLSGRIIMTEMLVKEPNLTVHISRRAEEKEEVREPVSFRYIQDGVRAILAPLSLTSPDLDIRIQIGQLDIVSEREPIFHFGDINSDMTSSGKQLNISFSCNSSFSKEITFIGNLNPETFNLQGKISLNEFRPEDFIDQVYPSDSDALAGAVVDMSFTFILYEPKMIIADLKGDLGASSFSGVNAEIDFSGEEPFIYIKTASLNLSLNQLFGVLISTQTFSERLESVRSVEGTVEVASAQVEGPLLIPSFWDFQLKGDARKVLIDEKRLPGPIMISSGDVEAVPGRLSFSNLQAQMLDTKLDAAGHLSLYMKKPLETVVTMKGESGAETNQWINEIAKIPPAFHINYPVTIKRGDFKWTPGTLISFEGSLSVPEGPDVVVEVARSKSLTSLKKLIVQDETSDAIISVDFGKRELNLKFAGNLTGNTASRLFPSLQQKGWVRGNFEARIPREKPFRFLAKGELEGGDFVIRKETADPLFINSVSASLDKNVISINRSELELGERQFTAEGKITSSDSDLVLDIHAEIETVTWKDIEMSFLQKNGPPDEGNQAHRTAMPKIRGTIEVSSDLFVYKRFWWSPIRAVVSLEPGEVKVDVPQAEICGISTPGIVTVKEGQVGLDFKGEARKQSLRSSLDCFMGRDANVTGTYNFTGHITAQGAAKELKRSLNGWVRFKTRDGIIYRYPLFSRIFSIVNVLEVFKGKYDDIVSKGFAYDSITVKGDVKKGKLVLREAVMDGSTMKVVGEGEVDLKDKDTDLTLIVSPLRTIDTIVEKIPIIKDITAGTLISIAMKVSGKIDDPQIITLPPSAVGEGIVGMVRRFFKLPLKLFEPEKTDKK